MFSLSEFFLIIFVALLVLGPSALQALLFRIGNFLRKSNKLIIRLIGQRPTLQKEQILAENNKRARKVDELYKKNKQALVLDFLPFFLELRLRLLYCVVVLMGTVCLLLPFSHYLYRCLAQPLLRQLPANSQLLSTTLTAPLFVPLKCTIIFSIFISMPFMLYQFWRFVAPALYLKEQRWLWLILLLGSGLFYSGVFFFYEFILPILIAFFITTSPSYVYIVPDIGHYLDLTLQLLMDFGLIFEMPLLVIIAVSSGFLTIKRLSDWRRYFIVLSFIVAMFLTPPDIVSQTLLAFPLCLLFEIGLFICRFIPEKNVETLR